MAWHGYVHISEIPPGWSVEQRVACKNALASMGRQADLYAHNITCIRANINNTEWIVESLFDESEIIRSAVVQLIAKELGVQYAAVDAKINYKVFANAEEARDYISADIANWETNE